MLIGIVGQGNYETAQFFPDKQQCNNAKPFPVYVNVLRIFLYMHEPGICSHLMFLHQNDSFALFVKFCLKIGML